MSNDKIDLDKLMKDFNEWNNKVEKKMERSKRINEETKRKLAKSKKMLIDMLDDKTNYERNKNGQAKQGPERTGED